MTAATTTAETAEVTAALRRAGIGDVDDSGLARALYSSDGSLYRVLPRAVVRPRDADEVVATLEVCRDLGVPLTMRGAGTSIAGNAVGTGVVVDTSRHLHRVHGIDAEARTAVVDPGVVQAALQVAARPHGLRFGPDPSTSNRCTVGGMIGNNACGSRALGYGRTSDNVVGLDVVTGAGERLRLSEGSVTGGLDDLRVLVARELATIRTELGRFGRQVSGYSLEHLLPERGFDVARALVGSEGTLAVVLGATVRLVADAPHRGLVVLGYPSMADAADATPGLLRHGPTAVEGLDDRIVQRLRDVPAAVVPDLPEGAGWLIVELTGDSVAEVGSKAAGVLADAGAVDSLVVTDVAEAAAIWRIREDGAGLAARTSDGRPAHAGWEDAAVPVESLGAYLREFEALLVQHGLQGVPYGHFGDGCVHVRIDFPFGREPDRGRAAYRAFVQDAAALVARYGGSVSGEHGDGRARSELLGTMYSPAALDLFGRVKALFDPADVLNPGVLVRPLPLDQDVRVAAAPRRLRTDPPTLALAYRHDGGDFSNAVHRCTGVGKCRAEPSGVAVMCPSWPATRQEKDNTRGRARVLQEMLAPGGPVRDWRSPEVHAALDLCLSCKGCSRDCPTGVDMASYKAEVLHQSYRRRLRPRSHYTLGRLPMWSDLAARAPRLVNAVTASRLGGRLARWGAGVDQRRSLPAFAGETFRAWWARRPAAADGGRPVALWVDSFTDHFAPEVARAAVTVLEAAGHRVQVPDDDTCCGLTWITTGQLDTAKRVLGHTVRRLAPLVDAGIPVVGLEPSCTAALRSDAVELLDGAGGGAMAARVAAGTRTLAELLAATEGWTPPSLAGVEVVAQPHCHHHAVMGWAADERLLRRAGATVTRLGGCCGLAGNWGVERGHHDVSVAIAEQQLLPAVRAAGPDAVVLADGFSCRTQLDQLADRPGRHLAQLLADALDRDEA
ncbi:FAD/FMN-containing dehydrogenase/Fe-S oxidoreductase [Geodermatophilus bullaregiensis]|uniref:FAD-binding and (Fe-S)-binding domain-containing protein n=1 Tax=Geodermatophilus bullaregiensis TaxID=1564160 RepID=UPI00195A32AF|nr:FAD-binding and (Fe-S)-binding domain-containing protein [Geodermatophilus bullaregiensis]MBM7808707.1 FAD/FMN-containing dehydrogenase/Fe-S oxidoreductase [Geodermatophilus bullaregiensis]